MAVGTRCRRSRSNYITKLESLCWGILLLTGNRTPSLVPPTGAGRWRGERAVLAGTYSQFDFVRTGAPAIRASRCSVRPDLLLTTTTMMVMMMMMVVQRNEQVTESHPRRRCLTCGTKKGAYTLIYLCNIRTPAAANRLVQCWQISTHTILPCQCLARAIALKCSQVSVCKKRTKTIRINR